MSREVFEPEKRLGTERGGRTSFSMKFKHRNDVAIEY